MSILLLRFAAPMQAWGSRSRFSLRDTSHEPTKSGVLGLLCAALGKPRAETPGDGFPTLAELNRLHMGVRTDREGTLNTDFQTAGGGRWLGARYGVAKASGAAPGTVISRRDFLADAVFLIGLEGPGALLAALSAAVRRPRHALCFGRKCFPPGEPVFLQFTDAPHPPLAEILAAHPWLLDQPVQRWRRHARDLKRPGQLRLTLECTGSQTGEVRFDAALSFVSSAREFAARRVEERWIECP